MTVQMKGITQEFGAVVALRDVDFSADRGQIQALVGENGAGKTTLMKALYGALKPTRGSIELEGKPVHWKSAADAIANGVGMVSQHYSIIPELTCLQNLMLGAEPGFVISRAEAEQRAEELSQQMAFRFDWRRPAGELSPAGAQKLEILKLLWRKADVMILDEPTAMLSPDDADALYASLTKLAERGAAVIVVTHRLPEVMDYCKTVTVLRGGVKMAEKPVSETNDAELAELIIGHGTEPPQITPAKLGKTVVQAKRLSVKGHRGDEALKSVDFELREGEVVGLAGVDGSGQRELIKALSGLAKPAGGELLLWGGPGGTAADRLKAGLRSIPEDRLAEAVIESWSLEQNAVLGLQRLPGFSKGIFSLGSPRAEFAQKAASLFRTKHSSTHQAMRGLSGGNQQRFVAGRALASSPRLVLAFQPARGLDIDGTALIYEELRRLCRAEGTAALVVSFDLDELITHCDRILAICAGRITEPPPHLAKDRKAIGALMVGAEP